MTKTKVVCMVRGGESGRLVQEQAINYSKQEDLRLVFLHIVDLSRLASEEEPLLEVWREELTWMGRITLGLAKKRAEESSLHPETLILYGAIFSTTVSFLQEHPVARLFIGSPHLNAHDYEQRLVRTQKFASAISEQTGVQVELVGD